MSKAIFPSIPAHKGPGVYKITDETNGKVYIGSSQNVYQRLLSHESLFRTGRQPQKMQAAFDAGHSFSCDILAPFTMQNSRFELLGAECDFIEKYDSIRNGYNSSKPFLADHTNVKDSQSMSTYLWALYDDRYRNAPIEDQSPHYGDYSTKWDKIKGEPQKRCECWIPARIADIFVLKLFEDGLSLDKFISDAIADYLGMDAINQTQQNTSITS